jgi:hypothetical protein
MGIEINVREEEKVVQTFCFGDDCDFVSRKLTILLANTYPEMTETTEQTLEEAIDDLASGEGEDYDREVDEFRGRLQSYVDKGYVIHKVQPSEEIQPSDEQISSVMLTTIDELGDL